MRDRSWFVWVGIASVVGLPIVYLDGIIRFVALPQIGLLHVFALMGMVGWFFVNTWRTSGLVLPAVIFVCAEVLSVFQAQNTTLSLLPISTHLAGFCFWLALANGLQVGEYIKIIRVGCGVAGGVSVLGLCQFVGLGQDWVPSSALPSATFGHRNLAAAYLVGMIPLTVWVWQQSVQRWAGYVWGVVLGCQMAFLMATRSRGAWVGFLGAVFVCAILALIQKKSVEAVLRFLKVRWQGAVLAGAIVVVFASLPANIGRDLGAAMWDEKQHIGDAVLSVAKPGGDKSRLILWQHTATMILQNPILGIGTGNWRLVYPTVAQGDLMDPRTVPERPHNDVLWICSEMGVLGIGAYGVLMWLAFRQGWVLTKTAHGALGWALICCLLGCFLSSLFGFSKAFPAVWWPVLLVFVGCVVTQKTKKLQVAWLRPTLAVGLVALVLAGIGVFRQIQFDRHLFLTRLAYEQSLWSPAIQSADRALSWGTFDESVFLMRGGAYAALGSSGKALQDYRAGLKFLPHSVGLWMGIGNVHREAGQVDEALWAYAKALEVDPRSGEIYNNLGTMYAAKGQRDSALVLFNRGLSYSPDLPALFANKSIVLGQMGEIAQALDAAEEAIYRDPDHLQGLSAKGQVLLQGRRFAEAAQVLSHIIQLYPDEVRMRFSLAQAYDGMGQVAGAVQAYQTFLEAWNGPDVPQVRFAKQRLNELSSP